MRLGLGLGLGKAGGTSPGTPLHPDAAALIAALLDDGATVSTGQRSAINRFFTESDANGWLSKIIDLRFPVWGNATPNSLNWITLTNGTFNGGITHETGGFRGNGTSGYLQTTTNPSTSILTNSNEMLGGLIYQAETNTDRREIISAQIGSDNCFNLFTQSNEMRSRLNNLTSSNGQTVASLTAANAVGVLLAKYDGVARTIQQRRTSGFSTLASVASGTTYGNLPNLNITIGANNLNGTIGQFSNAGIGATFISQAMSDSEAFSLLIAQTWEALTGLTLP